MNKFTHLLRFLQHLFDDGDTAGKAKKIMEDILKVYVARIFGTKESVF